MKIPRLRLMLILFLALNHAMTSAKQQKQHQKTVKARFEFEDRDRGSSFIFELTDPTKIKQADAILARKETRTIHVLGKIVKSKVPYNSQWSFYLDPKSIDFFEVAIEVCDASVQYVEEHLDEACGPFLPGCTWCPWSSMLIRRIKD